MRCAMMAVAGVWLSAGAAAAQLGSAGGGGAFVSRPIDPDALIVRPADQAAGFFSGASRAFARLTSSALEQNGFVRTVNNLFGTRRQPPPAQPNGLPAPELFPSTRYVSPLQPAMPTSQPFRR